MDMDQLAFDQCGKSVVRLHYGGVFHGSGFVIHTGPDECLILTCAHVVKGLANIHSLVNAYFPGENVAFQCKVLHGNETADLALLQNTPGDRNFSSVVPLEFLAEPVAFRQPIVLLSFYSLEDCVTPMLQPGTSTGNIIAQPDEESIEYSCSSKRGTSGGPIICSSAGAKLQVAGVHSKTIMGNSSAAPVEAIRKFLWEWVTNWKNPQEPFDKVSTKRMLEMGARLIDQVAADGVEEAKTALV